MQTVGCKKPIATITSNWVIKPRQISCSPFCEDTDSNNLLVIEIFNRIV